MLSVIKKNIPNFFGIALFAIVLFGILFAMNTHIDSAQHFSELADSFLHGRLYFLDHSLYNQYVTDIVLFNNQYYWPLGPLPAILLMPFVWLGQILGFYFYQGYLNLILILLIFFLIFKLSRRLKYSINESVYWPTAFIFSSMFLGVAAKSYSWYFAHTVVVTLLFLALLEYFGKKRYGLIGLYLGLILMTRVTAFGCILFFFGDIILDKNNTNKIKSIIQLSIAPIICLVIICIYNYLRFGAPFNQGYFAQILTLGYMLDKQQYGLFNLRYLPRGLYYSLINMPAPVYSSETHLLTFPFVKSDPWGMSIFATSPYLLYLFFLKVKDKKIWLMIITSIVVAFTIQSSFFIGNIQFGFRYALDFMPLLFIAFMMTYRNEKQQMGKVLKTVIILSALFNMYLLLN